MYYIKQHTSEYVYRSIQMCTQACLPAQGLAVYDVYDTLWQVKLIGSDLLHYSH